MLLIVLGIAISVGFFGALIVYFRRPRAFGPDHEYVEWLRGQSMLQRAQQLAVKYSGTGEMWVRPYAMPKPRSALKGSSVWFTAYPPSTIGRPGESVLQTFGKPELWHVFKRIGIKAMHIGPMKLSGSVHGREYRPTIDGNFDRISMDIDPIFGTETEYVQLTRIAKAHGSTVIGDVIPGHTGKGPDFRLAELAFADYPGIYHMVAIDPADWDLLPPVPPGRDSVNLSVDVVEQLHAKEYIIGRMTRVIFYEPGVKETNWSATDVVRGVDGVDRRWVYLHYFKEGQPTLNWLDPSFAAQRLVMGDILHSLGELGEGMLRLDANGFLGIEVDPKFGPAWSEGHPLSFTANQLLAGMVRKLGGASFQELNLAIEDIKAMSETGADLSYDFITRPAYHHALVTGDAEFLRLMLNLMHFYKIDAAGLIHALQNHDELTLELVHFWTTHKDDLFKFRGKELKGSELREIICAEMHAATFGANAPYNMKAQNGVACTTVSLIAAALGIKDINHLTYHEKQHMQKLHLLLAMFNAFQAGVFAISGWDLVGALTLSPGSVAELLADGDTRWINRGAYDLLGYDGVLVSAAGLPKAATIYEPLSRQLQDENSFALQLSEMLRIREECKIPASEQLPLPPVKAKGLVVMLHKLPNRRGIAITALNFGREIVQENIPIPLVPGLDSTLLLKELYTTGGLTELPAALLTHTLGGALNPLSTAEVMLETAELSSATLSPLASSVSKLLPDGTLSVYLRPFEGKALLLASQTAEVTIVENLDNLNPSEVPHA